MKTIHKFTAPIEDKFEIQMPAGAQILSVQLQSGKPQVWALVDTSARLVKRRFRLVGTGHPITGKVGTFVGTVQPNGGVLVFHLFALN